MTPEAYFQQYRRLYWLALAGPVLTAGYCLARMLNASDGREALRHGALAAVTAAQAVGLLRIRPSTGTRGTNARSSREGASRDDWPFQGDDASVTKGDRLRREVADQLGDPR